ncbi:MAG: DUF4838 domain-containing protein [Victivallales bacterium]|jgi:hypothetical protein|nr:DUF4838 domain-containing protein [Victivallales bacterium]
MNRMIGLTILLLGTAVAHALPLAQAKQARAVIVVGEEPTPAEKTAAAELAKYLKQITGADFRIGPGGGDEGLARVLVGPSQAARTVLGSALVDELGPEEFIVRTVGNDLLLVGGRPRGTLYAVYSFLDHDLGCRWTTWYGDESIPHRPTLSVPALNRREAPAMAVRDIVTHPNRNSDRRLLQRFLVRNRCQGPDLRFTGKLTAVGGTSHRFGFPPKGHLVHTLFKWVPPEVHFGDHPEWYSLAGDKRVPKRQLCFTNVGLRTALTKAVLTRIGEADPGGMYSVSAMDWTGAFCDCKPCRALVAREGTPGAPLYDYLAALGPQVAERYPKARISTLAYRKGQSEPPPRTIRLPDNVVIIFAPIDDNFAAPIEDPSNADTLRNLKNWPRATSNLWVWYYPNTYGPALPMGNLHRLAKDFRLFKRIGVKGYYIEQDAPGVYDSRRLADLQTWLITRLMWNPALDVDALIADYTDHHYGPAAPMIRQYIAALESATGAMQTRMRWKASTGQHRFLTPKLLLGCQRLLDAGRETVADDPRFLTRVEQARMSLDLACILRWDRLAAAGDIPFTKQQLVTRYRDTYTAAVRSRALPKRQDALLKALSDSLKWHAVMKPLKPLPPPLDAIPAQHVRQFTPETAFLYRGVPKIVEDPAAAAGIAVAMKPSLSKPSYAPAGLPPNVLNMGFYDELTRRQQHAYAGKDDPIKPGDYRLYPIGRTVLSSQCYVWFDWSWEVQFHDVSGLYNPDEAGKQWDVYASIRFEGPAYNPQAPAKQNRFYVDRVVFVAAER